MPPKKLELFRQAFFPPPPDVDLEDIRDYAYPTPLEFPPITFDEVLLATRKMPEKKAPGKDTFPATYCMEFPSTSHSPSNFYTMPASGFPPRPRNPRMQPTII
jgi:hypothetical protein